MRVSTLSRFKICRKLRLDIWGDVLYSSRRTHLLRRFKWWRVYPKRGRARQRYGLSRRLLYTVKQHRVFINWFKTAQNPVSNMRFSRRLDLNGLIKRTYRGARIDFRRLLRPSRRPSGAKIDSQDKCRYRDTFSLSKDNLGDYRVRSPFFKKLLNLRRWRRNESRTISRGFRNYVTDYARERARAYELRDRITRRWPTFARRQWKYRPRRSRRFFRNRHSGNQRSINQVFLSPRLPFLSSIYTNIFNELSLIRPLSVYSPQYSRFIQFRDPSWFFDNASTFFRGFHRRFFSLKMYHDRISSKYFSNVYDYLSNSEGLSLYRKGPTKCFVRRVVHSDRPGRRFPVAFTGMFKLDSAFCTNLEGFGDHKHVFEIHRHSYRRDLRKRGLLAARPFLLRFLSGDRDKFRLQSRSSIISKEIQENLSATPVGQCPGDERVVHGAELHRGSRYRYHDRGFNKDRRRRVFKPTRFTSRDYMSILLNRSRQTRPKRKTLYKLGMFEKRKLKFFYGFISDRIFRSLYKHYQHFQNDFFFRFVRTLESRLFMVLVRSGFFSTPKLTKQLILHARVKVNGGVVADANYLVRRGDLITFDLEDSTLALGSLNVSRANRKLIPRSNLVVSYKLPAIIFAGNLRGLHQIHYRFCTNVHKLNHLFKA